MPGAVNLGKGAAFTPGPWEACETNGGHEISMASHIENPTCYRPWHRIEYDHGCYVDDDYEDAQRDFAEAEANARLIAAAPTMYAYIERQAILGDAEAIEIVEAANGRG